MQHIIEKLLPSVIKQNGKMESFSPLKITEFLMREYFLRYNIADDICKKVIRILIAEKRHSIHSFLINNIIELELIERNLITLKLPLVKTSEGRTETFNSERIIESLINETYLQWENAERLTKLLIMRLKRSKIEFLSSPLIREMMCSILTENGKEVERKLYTRLGNPRADIEELYDLLNKPPLSPRNTKTLFQLQITHLVNIDFFKEDSIGILLFKQLREFFALRNWEFNLLWAIENLLNKFKSILKEKRG